jgi:uncharacterized membrane protein YidH (DUF202 family)
LRIILLFLFIASFTFAAGEDTSFHVEMETLCTPPPIYLGVLAMSLLLFGFLVMIISSLVGLMKGERSRTVLVNKVRDAGVIIIISSFILVLTYVLAPFIISTLLSVDLGSGSNLSSFTLTLLAISFVSIGAGYWLFGIFTKKMKKTKSMNRIWMQFALALVVSGILLAFLAVLMHNAYTSYYATLPPGCF